MPLFYIIIFIDIFIFLLLCVNFAAASATLHNIKYKINFIKNIRTAALLQSYKIKVMYIAKNNLNAYTDKTVYSNLKVNIQKINIIFILQY